MVERDFSDVVSDRKNIRTFLLVLWGFEKSESLNDSLSEKCGYVAGSWSNIWSARHPMNKNVLSKLKLAVEQTLGEKDGDDDLHAQYRALNWESMRQRRAPGTKKTPSKEGCDRKNIQEFLLTLWGLQRTATLHDLLSEKCGYVARTWGHILTGRMIINDRRLTKLIVAIEQTLGEKNIQDVLHTQYRGLNWQSIRGEKIPFNNCHGSPSYVSSSTENPDSSRRFIFKFPVGHVVSVTSDHTGITVTITPSD